MAINNFYTVVNQTKNELNTTINNTKIFIANSGQQSTGHKFSSGENINIKISGRSISLFLPKGKNSWSTIVYNSDGIINIFPSSNTQFKLSF